MAGTGIYQLSRKLRLVLFIIVYFGFAMVARRRPRVCLEELMRIAYENNGL